MATNNKRNRLMRRAEKMIRDDIKRNQAFEAYEEMYHNGWSLPPAIRALPWIRKVISSDPHDAVKAGVRILATIPVSLSFQPLAPGSRNQKRADAIEKNLLWQLKSANLRRSKSVEAEIVKSALLYDTVAAQVLDLDYQIEQKEVFNLDPSREKALKRNYGRFMVRVHNPRNVHVRYSGLMPEAVLLRHYKEASEVIDEWGEGLAEKFPQLREIALNKEFSKVWYFDYVDYNRRMVWVVPGTNISEDSIDVLSGGMVIIDDENPLPFLPWVALMGGDGMEDDPVHKYQPLLYGVYTTGAWETQNVVETLMTSEVIAHSGSPRYVESGPNTQETKFEYMSPERLAKVPPGNQFDQLQPPGLDRALAEIDAMFAAKMDKTTVSRILQGGDLPSGIAFATLNLATQTAVGVLKPAKDLAQKTLAQVFTLMLHWVEFTGEDLYAYDTEQGDDFGASLVVEADTIKPEAIYIESELHPDTPTDRQQKINSAAMAVERLMMPVTMALEEIGVQDPHGAIRESIKERLLNHRTDMRLERDRAMLQLEIQEMAMQLQQQAAQQQQGAQQAAAQAQMLQSGGAGAVPGGPAFDANQGGQQSAANNPNLTRETVTGLDFLGGDVEQLSGDLGI